MNRWLAHFFALVITISLIEKAQGQSISRGPNFTIVPVATDGSSFSQGAGAMGRDADHGSVAMNNQKDIVVAFHSTRDAGDLDDQNFDWDGEMKQVELAYFKYQNQGGVEPWEFVETSILGCVEYSPLAFV